MNNTPREKIVPFNRPPTKPLFIQVVKYLDPVIAVCYDCGHVFKAPSLGEVYDLAEIHREICEQERTLVKTARQRRDDLAMERVYLAAALIAAMVAVTTLF